MHRVALHPSWWLLLLSVGGIGVTTVFLLSLAPLPLVKAFTASASRPTSKMATASGTPGSSLMHPVGNPQRIAPVDQASPTVRSTKQPLLDHLTKPPHHILTLSLGMVLVSSVTGFIVLHLAKKPSHHYDIMMLSTLANTDNEPRPAEKPNIIIVDSSAVLDEYRALLLAQKLIAVDVEGVFLSRIGRLSLVQIGIRDGQCFLFDVLDKPPSSDIAQFLKTILEDETVTKIIHDCRTDSDALFHRLGIRLTSVHDTQAWAKEPMNLNATLNKFNCPTNRARDRTMYQDRPAFWAQRPLTSTMIAWASQDIGSLFQLYDRQAFGTFGVDRLLHMQMKDVCDARLAVLRDAAFHQFRLKPGATGAFIGKNGSNIKKVESITGAKFSSAGTNGEWIVYAKDQETISLTMSAIDRYL